MLRPRNCFLLHGLAEKLFQVVVKPVVILLFGRAAEKRETEGKACSHDGVGVFGLTSNPAAMPIAAKMTAINPASRYDIPKKPCSATWSSAAMVSKYQRCWNRQER